MARVISLLGNGHYVCDLCGAPEDRVLTDSHTEKDICFDCASTGEKGLFWTVTTDPMGEGDNLMEEAEAAGVLRGER